MVILSPTHLEGQLGAHSVAYLVNNLRIEAATVVHVTHQNWKCLANRQISHVSKRKQAIYSALTEASGKTFSEVSHKVDCQRKL